MTNNENHYYKLTPAGKEVMRLRAENEQLRKANAELTTLGNIAIQLALRASDWNLDEVEIDDKMVDINSVLETFRTIMNRVKDESDSE